MPAALTLTLRLAMFAFVGLSMSAFADLGPLDAMVMPGEVIKGHAKFEKTCRYCHVSFRKSAQAQLCLDCHDHRDVADDIAKGRGYHGRIKKQQCSVCHTDHHGRDANIAPLNMKTFDHDLTDYPLAGAHADAKVKCQHCHKPNLKYRDAPSQCSACHKDDDVHKGKLGQKCVNCHVDSTWKKVRFDHSRTKFPLEGRHLFAKCTACHANERYKNTPKNCYGCHRRDDDTKGHKGRFGRKCESCHNAERWTISLFNHDKSTDFPLAGKHRFAKCTACHKGSLYKEKLKTNCYACHKNDDDKKGHKGRFGTKCDSCHTPRDWKRVTFDHNRHTKFPLRGKHGQAKCAACHKGILYQESLKTTCFSCHEKDDAHKGQEGKQCGRCHNEQSWKGKIFFDHGLSRFPLLGKHADVPCEDCHRDTTFKDASTECWACHQKDDVHKRRLGTFCEQCHNARDWRQWDFDHDRRTRFRLDGAHDRLGCLACHKRPAKKKIQLGTACLSCHRTEDIHAGAFGPFCDRCHVTSSFRKIKPGVGALR
jgi:hypothetical protein